MLRRPKGDDNMKAIVGTFLALIGAIKCNRVGCRKRGRLRHPLLNGYTCCREPFRFVCKEHWVELEVMNNEFGQAISEAGRKGAFML